MELSRVGHQELSVVPDCIFGQTNVDHPVNDSGFTPIMSSLKRSSKVGQRIHRERPQPESRAQFGLLEKKKDYVQRARDYNFKKAKLQRLRQKALNRNPDEFHFHMIRSHIGDDGVHHENTPEPDEDTLVQKKLKNLEDLKYVKHRLNVENQKIEKLKATLHFADTTVAKNTHTIFVDTEEEAKNFDPVRYFNTPKEVLDRRYNRPRISTLQSSTIINAKRKSDVKEADHERRKMYSELLKRLQRAKELKVVVEKLEVKRNVVESKGKELRPKKVAKGQLMKPPVYKWIYERKK
uniref:U3 small nucleolar RNA-associated protein 11 n=2 Tax=Wuchereria bancrofti TaxID=6293 RepID=A0A1I8ERH9_WUCBA